MNTVTPERKEKVMKSLAILGFFAIIGIIAWASVVMVSYAPKAFTSLASIAQSLNNYKNSIGEPASLTITSGVSTTTVGTPTTLSWSKSATGGTYSFSYSCTDGVSLDIIDTEGLRTITCDTRYDLGNVDTVTVVADSKGSAATSISYTIQHTSETGVEPAQTVTGTLAITTGSTVDGEVLGKSDNRDWKDSIVTKSITNTSVEVNPKKEPTTKPAPTTSKEPPKKPTLPASNVNGYVDLSARFLSTGIISGNTYTAKTLAKGDEGAFQFAVVNLGDKTSAPWSYTVTLPDGDSYTSPLQDPLRPREEARVALGFPIVDSTTYTLVVVIATDESNLTNNSFTQKLTFTK